MHNLSRPLFTTIALLILHLHAAAQGPYYVNGQTGLDAAGNGTAPTTPWKTIGYALAHVAPQTVSTSDIVYVEGNQEYSPTTNGETFPIVPAYNIALEGTFAGHGNMPVMRLPAGATGFAFPGDQWFNRNQVTFRYLILDGGAYGMTMGAAPGFRHRPRVQECTFRNQTTAGVSVVNSGNAIDDPRFFQNQFESQGGGVGIQLLAQGSNSVVAPDVEECSFRRLAQGLDVTASGTYRSCNIADCDVGISVFTIGGTASISDCRIVGCSTAIRLDAAPLPYPIDISRVSILSCGIGVHSRAALLDVIDSSVRSCATGISCDPQQLRCFVRIVDTSVDSCGLGVSAYQPYHTSTPCDVLLERTRIHRCQTGIAAVFNGHQGSSLTVRSSMICQTQGEAVRFTGHPGTPDGYMILSYVTIADNAIGIHVQQPPSGSADNMILAGNVQDLIVPTGFSITHSAFQNTSWTGAGNLNFTDPQIIRPVYKLAPTSPCIDAGSLVASSPGTDYESDPRAGISALGGSAVPDIGADEYLYAGSANPYGTGGFGPFNVFPRISSPSTAARIGQSIQIDLNGAIMPAFGIPANLALLSFGWRDDSGALPFDLALYGIGRAWLLDRVEETRPQQPSPPFQPCVRFSRTRLTDGLAHAVLLPGYWIVPSSLCRPRSRSFAIGHAARCCDTRQASRWPRRPRCLPSMRVMRRQT